MVGKYSSEERQAKAKEIHDLLQEQLLSLDRDSDSFKKFLTATSNLFNYSLSNILWIMAQRKDATYVRGFKQWQDEGRQVIKGAKGIQIFGRQVKQLEPDEDAPGDSKEKVFYPIRNVFDVSDTVQIDPSVPDRFAEKALKPVVPDELELFAIVEQHIRSLGFDVVRDYLGGADAAVSHENLVVTVDPRLKGLEAATALLHELAHITLEHNDIAEYNRHRGLQEVEAESTAFVVAGVLGVDTTQFSVKYIDGWAGGDIEVVKKTAMRVIEATRTITDALLPEPEAKEVKAADYTIAHKNDRAEAQHTGRPITIIAEVTHNTIRY